MKLSLKLTCTLAVLIILAMAATPTFADTGKPSIAVGDVSVSPSALMPGDTGAVTVTLVNPTQSLSGESKTKMETFNYGPGESNGLATPSYTEQTTTQSSNAPDGAIALKEVALQADGPIEVTSAYHFLDVGRLGMGCSYKFTFIVKADGNATDGTYFLTLKVRTDDDGVYLNYPVTIKVDSTPLNISVSDSPDSFTADKQTVTLDVVNDRSDDVSGVAILPSGDGYDFSPGQQYVIGAISAGETSTAQIDVAVNNASKAGDPSFRVVYKNGDNRHDSLPAVIPSGRGTADAAAPPGSGNAALYVAGLIVVFVVLLGGVFLYLSGKRAKK